MNLLFTKFILLAACILLINTEVLSQKRNDKAAKAAAKSTYVRAKESIEALKNGVLVVRLESDHRKILKLRELIDVSEGVAKLYFENILSETIASEAVRSNQIMHSFNTLYSFSPVLFMYDTASVALKTGVESGIFLNGKREIDPALSLEGRTFLVFKNNGLKDYWTIGDKTLEDLSKPFPYKTFIKRILIFNIPVDGIVFTVNARLTTFYALVH